MLDIKNFIEEDINFKEYDTNNLVFYKNKKIQFYLKNCKNITEISEYQGKKNILVKINKEYENFFDFLEKKFLEEKKKDKKNFISLMKKNNNGTIIKLKVNKRREKSFINIYNKFKEEILEEELEKNNNIDCLIEIDRFWEYNGKIGYIIIVKKIYMN